MEYNKENYTNLLVYLSFIIFFVLVMLFSPKNSFKMYDTCPKIMGNWTYRTDTNDLVITAKHDIEDNIKGQTIEFFTEDNYVDAYIGNKQIYHFGKKNNLGKTPGHYWHFISIPDTAKDEISIIIRPAFKSAYKDTYKFYIGEKTAIASMILSREKINMVLSILILTLGIILCLMHIIERINNVHHDETLYLSILSILFAVWRGSQLFCFQTLAQNMLMPYYLYYASLICLGITLTAYIEKLSAEIHTSKEHSFLIVVVAVLCIFHLFKVYDFAQTINIYIAIVTGVILICGRKIIINFKNITGRIKRITICLLFILYLFVSLGFILNLDIEKAIELSNYGILILICSNIYASAIRMVTMAARTKEIEIIKEMAYKDNLTKAFNRNALEHDTEGIGLKNLVVASFDLNNLKYYNDTFGHTYGDELILTGSSIIREVYGRVYRTGGDEFLCLVKNKTEEEMQGLYQELKEKIQIYNNKQSKIILEIACGYAFYQEDDKTYEDILKRADIMMYKNKKEIKLKSKISFARNIQPN